MYRRALKTRINETASGILNHLTLFTRTVWLLGVYSKIKNVYCSVNAQKKSFSNQYSTLLPLVVCTLTHRKIMSNFRRLSLAMNTGRRTIYCIWQELSIAMAFIWLVAEVQDYTQTKRLPIVEAVSGLTPVWTSTWRWHKAQPGKYSPTMSCPLFNTTNPTHHRTSTLTSDQGHCQNAVITGASLQKSNSAFLKVFF